MSALGCVIHLRETRLPRIALDRHYRASEAAEIHPRPKSPCTSNQISPAALARAPDAYKRVSRFRDASRRQ